MTLVFMQSLLTMLFGRKVGKTRITPVTTKILFTFIILIFISNLSSNYINLTMNRSELIKIMKELLVKDLREMQSFMSTQWEIYQFTHDRKSSYDSIQQKAATLLKNNNSFLVGLSKDGSTLIQSAKGSQVPDMRNTDSWNVLQKNLEKSPQGFVSLSIKDRIYLATYSLNENWEMIVIRAEEESEFYKEQRKIFRDISLMIAGITLVSAIVGIYLLRYILRFVGVLTRSILNMADSKNLDLISMKGASNDDITFLGMAFNSLSATVNNLLNIFRKFANQDVVIKAYRDREVKLEGVQQELAILFSDIKGFTYITETLGTDIIKLLNMHYDRAIRHVLEHNGLIGAIIGDALLSIYGALDEESETVPKNKSLEAVVSGYEIQEVAKHLREEMNRKKEEILREAGSLTPEEEKVFKAVMLEVGVGIDGGEVFYGTIGSYLRMTNTVIGDRVNSASRLEGLTRVYKVPMIVSEYVRNDITENVKDSGITFVEIDTVQVKGKTTGTRIFWPLLPEMMNKKMKEQVALFEEGLEAYYKGTWTKAHRLFNRCELPMAEEFVNRTKGAKTPAKWNGIWEMKTK